MTKEKKFYETLQNIFIGAKIEGTGGFINLMRIKSKYYEKIKEILKQDIDKALEKYPSFREELYLNPNTNKMEKFKPDFIFWLKKRDFYLILFIDPKGVKHTDFLQKIDGYSRIFEEKNNVEKKPKVFNYRHGDENLNVIVKLFIKPFKGKCPDNYSQYCFDNFNEIFEQIKKEIVNQGEHLCTNN